MSRREFRGLTVLWVLIVIVTLLPATFSWLLPEKIPIYKTDYPVKNFDTKKTKSGRWKQTRFFNRVKYGEELFKFDPNTLDAAGWQRLGLSPKQASVILNYRTKGGKFSVAEDVGKMYTIKPSLYARIAPFIRINVAVTKPSKPAAKPTRTTRVIELNNADTLQLLEINGIGPAFARRIYKYRELLGGFYGKGQLTEVFGLDSIKYEEIKEQVKVDPVYIKKIMINSVSLEILKNHPYLRYKQANAIIQYRKQHGNYSNIADLNRVTLLSAETIDKIEPYLSFQL